MVNTPALIVTLYYMKYICVAAPLDLMYHLPFCCDGANKDKHSLFKNEMCVTLSLQYVVF